MKQIIKYTISCEFHISIATQWFCGNNYLMFKIANDWFFGFLFYVDGNCCCCCCSRGKNWSFIYVAFTFPCYYNSIQQRIKAFFAPRFLIIFYCISYLWFEQKNVCDYLFFALLSIAFIRLNYKTIEICKCFSSIFMILNRIFLFIIIRNR